MKDVKQYIELIMAATIPLALLLIMFRTVYRNKGIGARTVQFVSILSLIPAIIILAIEEILKGETVATLLGGLAGYVLSGVGGYDGGDNDKGNSGKKNVSPPPTNKSS
ncbi:hypothetical protein [Mucilaginibacter sp.]